MAKAIFSIEKNKIKNTRQFYGKYKHNHRLSNVQNADKAREHMNKELISLPEGETYTAAYHRIMKSLDYYKTHKLREGAVRGFEVMLTYGSKDFPPDFDQERWEQENVKWLQETFGKENVIEAVLHMDEKTPHIHAIVIPVVDGRLCAKELIGGPAGLMEKQESYAARMQELGLEPRTKYSVAQHEDIMSFYTAVNEATVERLPEPYKNRHGEYTETVEEYFERANGYLVKRNLQNLNKQKEMERAIVEAKNSSIKDDMEKATMLSELTMLRDMMGDNIEENKKKMKMIEYINLGLKEHPDREFAKAAKETISALVSFAIDHEKNKPEACGLESDAEHKKEGIL